MPRALLQQVQGVRFLMPGSGRSPGGGHDYPLPCSCLENPHGQRNLAGSSPWSRKASGVTEYSPVMFQTLNRPHLVYPFVLQRALGLLPLWTGCDNLL